MKHNSPTVAAPVEPPDKPDWSQAPEWADAIGVATWECDYQWEWCWMRSAESKYFAHVEKRPIGL